MSKNINPFLQWWMTPKLPAHYIRLSTVPKEQSKQIRLYIRHFLFHPIKRRVAKYYLKFLQTSFDLKVIGITGSSGKTTTKDMIASILETQGKVVKSFANIDPVFNIPTTILKCTPNTKYLILEMGVEYPCEIPFYLWLAKPKIGIITNIYQTHTQFFGSIQGVADEKSILVKSLGLNDWSILNKENNESVKIGERIKSKILWFGNGGDVYATNVNFKDTNSEFNLHIKNEEARVNLPILGIQFVENALASASCASILGITIDNIKKGLELLVTPEHRMNTIKLKNGAFVIDDSYNNNPTAAKIAVETLAQVAKNSQTTVVFGDMLELGATEEKRHREIGQNIGKLKINNLIAVGKLSKKTFEEAKSGIKNSALWVEKSDEVYDKLLPFLKKGTFTLIKGSRSIGLDKLVAKIVKNLG